MPQVSCPACQKVFRIKDELIGKRVRCQCGSPFVVPGETHEAIAPAVSSTDTRSSVTEPAPNTGASNPAPWGSDVPAAPINPYAPIASTTPLVQTAAGDESIRKSHLSHEASIKSIGILYLIGAFFGFLLTILYVVLGIGGILFPGPKPNEALLLGAVMIVLAVVVGAISTFQFVLARGLRRLTPWCRIGGIVFSCFGLLGFPIGTLISGYFLYLLASQKGVYVFSPEYARVIAATPHIRYKTSIIVWIQLGILLTLIGLGIIAAVAGVVMG